MDRDTTMLEAGTGDSPNPWSDDDDSKQQLWEPRINNPPVSLLDQGSPSIRYRAQGTATRRRSFVHSFETRPYFVIVTKRQLRYLQERILAKLRYLSTLINSVLNLWKVEWDEVRDSISRSQVWSVLSLWSSLLFPSGRKFYVSISTT
jgi:hypothetical protein